MLSGWTARPASAGLHRSRPELDNEVILTSEVSWHPGGREIHGFGCVQTLRHSAKCIPESLTSQQLRTAWYQMNGTMPWTNCPCREKFTSGGINYCPAPLVGRGPRRQSIVQDDPQVLTAAPSGEPNSQSWEVMARCCSRLQAFAAAHSTDTNRPGSGGSGKRTSSVCAPRPHLLTQGMGAEHA